MPQDRSRYESASDDSDASEPTPAELPNAKVDLPRIEKAVREILLAVGENPDREGLL
jgi:GTP cyclohydrolase I